MAQTSFQGQHSDLTDKILAAFFKVHRTLGYGFDEKVYENSLASAGFAMLGASFAASSRSPWRCRRTDCSCARASASKA